jgi:eukaryotic-like serine/threonine-protein kinase
MVTRISQCDPQQLQLGLDDLLEDSQAENLCRHLQSCPHCRAELEQLAGGKKCWDAIKANLSPRDAAADKSAPNGFGSLPKTEESEAELPLDFLTPSNQPDMLGRLGHYEVQQVIGRGGMGVVLKAQDPDLNRCVAIKVMAGHLNASAAARKRFAREAQAAAAVVHDHVIPIFAVEPLGQTPFLVMPYVSGRSLQDRLDERGPLETKEVLRIALQTAQGLAAAHAQGLVHRDIKPANILLENGVQRVRITDFGLARASDDASQTQSGFIAGTPQYMSPEQARGEPIDARADLFSLGSVMFAMCTGHPPFRAETTFAVLRRVCEDMPREVQEINPETPLWLARIIAKLLAKSPNDRFQTAASLADQLERWLAHVQQPNAISPPEVLHSPDRDGRGRLLTRRILIATGGVFIASAAFYAASKYIAAHHGTNDQELIHGTWKVVVDEGMDKEHIVGNTLTFTRDGRMTIERGWGPSASKESFTYSINSSRKPKTIEIWPDKADDGRTLLGIYEVNGDQLRLCIGLESGQRPKNFGKSGAESVYLAAELERQR